MSKILYRILKRILDLILGTILWILFSPLMLIVSIFIKLSDGGEIFVGTPVRIGANGNTFFMYKFRTMVVGASSMLSKEEKIEMLNNHKLNNDRRVTKLGRLLRSTDIDELPQLINVLLGNMSLVGPRPYYDEEVICHLDKYPEDKKYFDKIFNVKPGITGVWQVSGRNSIPFRERLKMDAQYSNNLNILLDILILLKTPWVVITRKGVKYING